MLESHDVPDTRGRDGKLDLARFGELAGIAQKIEQDLPQPHGVHGQRTKVLWGVCTENSDSTNVLVMQAADQGMRYDASGALNRARDGRVLV